MKHFVTGAQSCAPGAQNNEVTSRYLFYSWMWQIQRYPGLIFIFYLIFIYVASHHLL